jgi:hypothetical protein
MSDRQWQIGICGTFDVANYGDLLFPLIAESELSERLGAVTLHRFSYYSRTPPAWPYEVSSIVQLPDMIDRLDGLLIGGGFLIRFDKTVAPGYFPPSPEIHHPTGYWLTPALIALQHNVPLVWNAPGVQSVAIPAWAKPLLATALTSSRYVSVRDEPSRAVLESLTSVPIAVVPDTAFALPRLLDLEAGPSAEFTRIRDVCGLEGPYIVLQATRALEGFVNFVKTDPERFRDFQFLALPVGPVLGDDDAMIDADLPGVVRLDSWPSPLVIAELIGRSEAVVGESYHLCITAATFGVPAFTVANLSIGKYSVLRNFDTIYELPRDQRPDRDWLLARLGRTTPSVTARATCGALRNHWDRIAQIFQAGGAPTAPAFDKLWQFFPALLEPAELVEQRAKLLETVQSGQIVAAALEVAQLQEQLNNTGTQLAEKRTEIAEIRSSLSWRLTAPLRLAGRLVRKPDGPSLINLERIKRQRLEKDPYSWAAINDLFTPAHGKRLSATYPRDRFKLLSAFDGEKDYEYHARALIGMGADVVSYPAELSDAWRRLAADLLSPAYRAAMSALIGFDLSQAPMEVNVFHYGPGGSLGPHRDLPEKIVTHVLYFNEAWNPTNGGCLRILRSVDSDDVAAEIPPLIGNSSVLVRSENSWHAVSLVAQGASSSRRSVTVTFYRPGAVSTMWPPGDATPLNWYDPANSR